MDLVVLDSAGVVLLTTELKDVECYLHSAFDIKNA